MLSSRLALPPCCCLSACLSTVMSPCSMQGSGCGRPSSLCQISSCRKQRLDPQRWKKTIKARQIIKTATTFSGKAWRFYTNTVLFFNLNSSAFIWLASDDLRGEWKGGGDAFRWVQCAGTISTVQDCTSLQLSSVDVSFLWEVKKYSLISLSKRPDESQHPGSIGTHWNTDRQIFTFTGHS